VLLPDRLDAIAGRREILCCKHVRTPLARGDVWYHSWQAGGGFDDPLLREPAKVAEDLARRAVSPTAAREIYGVVLNAAGEVDASGTAGLRRVIREGRIARLAAPSGGGGFVMTGHGVHRYGALRADFAHGEIACEHCGHAVGAPGEDLLPKLGEFATPLSAAGAVRGEDYDEKRFDLRHLCCPRCGGLFDVQVAQSGASRPYASFDFG
jgi:N-methylhydantoinase B